MLQHAGIKFRLKWQDYVWIFVYNLTEPIIGAIALSISLQQPSLSSLLYIVLMVSILLPMTLSSHTGLIQLKLCLCGLIFILSIALTTLKVYILSVDDESGDNEDKNFVQEQLGIKQDQPFMTLLPDVSMILASVLLFIHYLNQKSQSEERKGLINVQAFQSDTKLLHPVFGREHEKLFALAYALYLIDTFLVQTFVQLGLIVILLLLMYAWQSIVKGGQRRRYLILRAIQIAGILQFLITYSCSLPVTETWLKKAFPKFLVTSSMIGLSESGDVTYKLRLHLVVLSLATFASEIFFVAQNIDNTKTALQANMKTLSERTQQLHRRRNSRRPAIGKSDDPRQGAYERFQNFAMLQSQRQSNVGIATGPTRRLSQQFKQIGNKVWLATESSFFLWTCRLFGFIHMYMYHDFQSIPMFVWFCHSTLFKNSEHFKKAIIFVYLPILTIVFLWYYLVNITDFISWPQDESLQRLYYRLGIYNLQMPALEIAFMFLTLACFLRLALSLSGDDDEITQQQQKLRRIGSNQTRIIYKFLFLSLIYVEYPLMIFLVCAGLTEMDIYHVTMLLFFVIYTASPNIIKKRTSILLCYANFFVLEKYVYSLVQENIGETKDWVLVIGLQSSTYDPYTTREYFRYAPRLDQWALVLLSFLLYRRSAVLATDDREKFITYRKMATDAIKLKQPNLYRFYIQASIFFNHIVVILGIGIFLAIISFIERTFMNAMTQSIVLILLCVYLSSGTQSLLRYWRILIVYQAFVLTVLTTIQIFANIPDIQNSRLTKIYQDINPFWRTILYIAGFQKVKNPFWLHLLPYVVLFSISVIMFKAIRIKLMKEQKRLFTSKELKNPEIFRQSQAEHNTLINIETEETQETVSNFDSEQDFVTQTSITSQRTLNLFKNRLAQFKPLQRQKTTLVSDDSVEYLNHKQYIAMKFKSSYIAYQSKRFWPILDEVAAHIHLINGTIVLVFAIYYQIAIVWGILLIIYILQIIWFGRLHWQYRESGAKVFEESQRRHTETKKTEDDAEQAISQMKELNEDGVYKRGKTNMQTNIQSLRLTNESNGSEVFGMRASSVSVEVPVTTNQDRSSGVLMRTNTGKFDQARPEQKRGGSLVSDKTFLSTEKVQLNAAKLARQSKQIWDKAASAVDDVIANNRGSAIVDHEKAHVSYSMVIQVQHDSQDRLKITDQQVLEEFKSFTQNKHGVTVSNRYYAWIAQFIILILALSLLYISTFINIVSQLEPEEGNMFQKITRNNLIFLFFWGGVYSEEGTRQYLSNTYPFYLLILLSIFERVSQRWIKDRFECSEEQMYIFKEIETVSHNYVDKAQKNEHEKHKYDNQPLKRQLTVEDRLTFLHKRTLKTFQRSATGLANKSSFTKKKKIITLEQTDEETEANQNIQELQYQRPGMGLQPIEEEDRDGSSRREDDDMERGFSVNLQNHSILFDPDLPVSERNNSTKQDNQARQLSQSQYLQKSNRLSFSINEDYEDSPYETIHPMTTKNNEIYEEHDSHNKIENDQRNLLNSYKDKDLVPLQQSYHDKEKEKQKLFEELRPLISVKGKLKFYHFLKIALQNIIILLVWFSCIYKQNVISLFLFVVLVIYQLNRNASTLLMVRQSIALFILLQYWLEVLNVSSYNSPKPLPNQLLESEDNSTHIYPSKDQFYYDIPLVLAFNATRNETTGNILQSEINLNVTSYFCMDVNSRKLDGLWLDFIVTVLVVIFFNTTNLWIIYKPVKITLSSQTKEKLGRYAQLTRQPNEKLKTIKETLTDLKQQIRMTNNAALLEKALFTISPMIMIAITLTVSVFNKSLLSFGYIIFVMFLIEESKYFFQQWKSKERVIFVLQWMMFPYLLFDILLTLIYQMPFQVFEDDHWLFHTIGFGRIWRISPSVLILGQEFIPSEKLTLDLPMLLLKGVILEAISIYIQIIQSNSYKKFMMEQLAKQQEHTQKIGQGITYRFNNFKNKKVIKSAQEIDKIEKMLWQVKLLLKKRDLLYKVNEDQDPVTVNKLQQQTKKNRKLPAESPTIRSKSLLFGKSFKDEVNQSNLLSVAEIFEEDNHSFNSQIDWKSQKEGKQEQRRQDKAEIRANFDAKMKNVGKCQKIYLWLRRNFVLDILFRKSDDHLDDIVEQLKNGRTCIKAKLEIGYLNEAKQECWEQKIQGLSLNDINRDVQQQELESPEESSSQSEEDIILEIDDNGKNARRKSSKKKQLLKQSSKKSEFLRPEPVKTKSGNHKRQRSDLTSRILLQDLTLPNTSQNDSMNSINNEKIYEKLNYDLYIKSSKPWEHIQDQKQNFTNRKLCKRYAIEIYKIFVSNSEVLCYFWMLMNAFTKPGALQMIYPLLIFGYAILEEQKPGRQFWFFVILYTQILIMLNFMIQLYLWRHILSDKWQSETSSFFKANSLGLIRYKGITFGDGFVFYFCEISTLFHVMLHILKETLTGVFDVPYEKYETFEEGLLRYRLLVLCQTEQERDNALAQLKTPDQIKISPEDIDPYRQEVFFPEHERFGYFSEFDKYEISEVLLQDPIRNKKQLIVQQEENEAFAEGFDTEYNSQEDIESDKGNQYMKRKAKSLNDLTIEQTEEAITCMWWFRSIKRLIEKILWDNYFFERLFPLIKQQKPGKDLYVLVATTQIVIVCYLFFFYPLMVGSKQSISEQFSTNSFSEPLVISLIVCMVIMVTDRILYSQHAFLAGKKNHQFGQQQEYAQTLTKDSAAKGDFYGSNIEASPAVVRNSQISNISAINMGIENSNFEFESDDSEGEQIQFKAYEESLIPSRTAKTWSRVIKFYYQWVLLLLAHWFVFYHCQNSRQDCIINAKLDKSQINIEMMMCNRFLDNVFLIIFYCLVCIYFAVSAYQMRIGLPEVRKGSFLVNNFNPAASIIYRGYLAIPFVFELRSIIDWTFTTTALDVFQWIKLAQIQANLYVAKCVNRYYYDKKIGKPATKVEKIGMGFPLMLGVLTLIIGPIVLFSTINPIKKPQPVDGGKLSVTFAYIDHSDHTNSSIPLFATNSVSQVQYITDEQYLDMDFERHLQTTAQFKPNQIQIVQFSPASDYSWNVSYRFKTLLSKSLQDLISGQMKEGESMSLSLKYEFQRIDSSYGPAYGEFKTVLNSTNLEIAENLLRQVNCEQDFLETEISLNEIFITKKTGKTNHVEDLQPANSLATGYKLGYNCTVFNDTAGHTQANFWTLKQVFGSGIVPEEEQPEVEYMKKQIFAEEKGFGFFVFEQKVFPSYLSDYSSNVIVFYGAVIYVIASLFRSVFVPNTWEIFIKDAPFTEDILKICQSIHIYRVQRDLVKEEELYHILIDIMRSPEMIKSLCGSSLKKKLQ